VRRTATLASAVVLLLAAATAHAQAVYKSVDETGRIVYTDRPPAANAAPAVKPPPRPSTYEYESARIRAEQERSYSQRLEWEERMRRPIVNHDPQGLQHPPAPPPVAPGINIRHDPNLPDAPPPTNERRYYYEGR
jgi:hypothetical protein